MSPVKKILLVEDNPDDEALVLMALKKHGIKNEIVTVRDGQAAIDYLLARGANPESCRNELPAVILLDLKLPKLNGLEVLQRLRAEPRTKHQPVVILTSSDEARDRFNSYDLGANSYVCKPVDYNEFSEAVHYLGTYWTAVNKSPKD